MLSAAIIVLREVLEASLVVSILLAATVGLAGRAAAIWGGVAAGAAGAALVAGFAGAIAAAVAGIGQELFNATVLLAAVAMLAWHTVWMARHGRELAAATGAVGRAVAAGARPLWALGIVAGAAVLREGAEIVLFLYGIAAAGEEGAGAMLLGGLLGLAGGAALGFALYAGLLRIPLRRLFAVTNAMLVLLAAGMAAQAAAFLVQADLLPSLGDALWDTSFLLDDESAVGRVLHALVGYVAQPAGIQVLFWGATLAGIALASGAERASRRTAPAAAE